MSVKKKRLILVVLLVSALLMTSCKSPQKTDSRFTPTATKTQSAVAITPTEISNRCKGLDGVLELQLLVGPSDAVGLEPVAVGNIPFSVISNEIPYLIEGSNSIHYDDILEEKWGTYSVTFDMDITISGECTMVDGNDKIYTNISMSGDQMVIVVSDGFQSEYPWNGTHNLDLTFPLEEGATAGGEGWLLVLHLN
jgi:hypothetical protein